MGAFDPLVFDPGVFDAEEPATPGLYSWWGGWFPRGFGLSWWGYPERAWFPEGEAPETQPGTTPETVGLFLLESGTRMTLTYRTAIHKSYNGRERRAGLIDDPMLRFDGPATLNNAETRARRAQLARYAAQGLPFSLAMPWESLAVRAASTGSVVAVHSTALSDWIVPGARCVVSHSTHGSMEGVVQSSTSTTITLDVTLGAIGGLGAMIMPTIQIFLDAQQQFARYPTAAERWTLGARAAVAGLSSAAVKAELALEAPQTNSGVLDGLRLVAQTAGADGNLITVTQSDDALTSGGELVEDVALSTLHIKYMGDTTTLDEYVALLAGSSLVRLLGTYTGTDVLAAADDEFAATALSGGADPTPIAQGAGATLTTFAGRAIWDRGVTVQGTAPDSMQSMAETRDFGGLPFSAGMASVPDWGRDVKIEALRGSVEFQWFKLFLSTVQGAWKSWWLPTYREDLVWLSSGTGTITVDSAGEPSAWWPTHQTHVMIKQASGVVTYARVTACVDNGDDTSTLTLVDEADAPVTLSGSAVTLISWLELVRMEDSGGNVQVPITFAGTTFSAQFTARVVKQDEETP